MPAAAVIPAPIAYIKVVAVKKLVVGPWARRRGLPLGMYCGRWPPFGELRRYLRLGIRTFTLKKLECLKQAYA